MITVEGGTGEINITMNDDGKLRGGVSKTSKTRNEL